MLSVRQLLPGHVKMLHCTGLRGRLANTVVCECVCVCEWWSCELGVESEGWTDETCSGFPQPRVRGRVSAATLKARDRRQRAVEAGGGGARRRGRSLGHQPSSSKKSHTDVAVSGRCGTHTTGPRPQKTKPHGLGPVSTLGGGSSRLSKGLQRPASSRPSKH